MDKRVFDLSEDTAPAPTDLLYVSTAAKDRKTRIQRILSGILTGTGDIPYRDSLGNIARLAIGTAGQVLVVNGAATAPEWADNHYVINGFMNAVNPADATTYYIGAAVAAPGTAPGLVDFTFPLAGTVVAAYVSFRNGTGGTTETSTISFRLNNATDTVISAAVQNDLSLEVFSNTGLSIAVVAGDKAALKWETPTWVTNPIDVRTSFVIVIKR